MPDALTDPLAQELAKLAPAPTAVTSAAVLYAAGVQSAEIKAKRWRAATGGVMLLFVGSWIGMAMKPEANSRSGYFAKQDTPSPKAPAQNPETPAPEASDTPATPSKPIPQLIASDRPDEDTFEVRAKGIRLRRDILAGGLGMIPDQSKVERPVVPNAGSMELNPTVLGGHYAPKKEEKPRD